MVSFLWRYSMLRRAVAWSNRSIHHSSCTRLGKSGGAGASIQALVPARQRVTISQLRRRSVTSRGKFYSTRKRGYAGITEAIASQPVIEAPPAPVSGPMEQYEQWVAMGKIRPDDYQREIVQVLQNVHDELKNYTPPKVVHPQHGLTLVEPPRTSMIDALFGRKRVPPPKTAVPGNVPKGLYLHGDVGSGKTMLMDMLYQTLPTNITSKRRIHFHHFMQDVHKRLHVMKMKHGSDFDAIPFVGAELAEAGSVLCFDEFQCTDVADAMILRRLLESLMSHGVVLICTSNRHPSDLYLNGIQRESFLPCIALLNTKLRVINLDSPTDYRKIRRPPASVYHFPAPSPAATSHADKWFVYLGDPTAPSKPAVHQIWGRDVRVPLASGKAARFKFMQLCGSPLSAADYLELTRRYNAFIVEDVPRMDYKTRDLARRFITFIDAVYESRAKLVLTLAAPPGEMFVDKGEEKAKVDEKDGGELDSSMRSLMDDLGLDMKQLKNSSIFTGDEERFAFARALSRLSEMQSVDWVERKE